MSTIEATAGKEAAVGKTAEPDQGRSSASRSYLLIAPSVIWMALFLVIPLAMIVYVSFWTRAASGNLASRTKCTTVRPLQMSPAF